ncbi:MAG: hypothetical protein GY804_07150 [Alphaproteobacteria bacterium]|nr:hypothetical protein [Alphaproteobacteria bacterium]
MLFFRKLKTFLFCIEKWLFRILMTVSLLGIIICGIARYQESSWAINLVRSIGKPAIIKINQNYPTIAQYVNIIASISPEICIASFFNSLTNWKTLWIGKLDAKSSQQSGLN